MWSLARAMPRRGGSNDELDPEVHDWAASREAPTLLIEPHSARGLDERHVQQFVAFSEYLAAQMN